MRSRPLSSQGEKEDDDAEGEETMHRVANPTETESLACTQSDARSDQAPGAYPALKEVWSPSDYCGVNATSPVWRGPVRSPSPRFCFWKSTPAKAVLTVFVAVVPMG